MLPGGLLDAIRDAVIFTDAEGRIRYSNEAASALFGYSAAEILGRTPGTLYPDVPADAPVKQLETDLAEIAGGTPFA
nr:PAS domain-containing protein [Gemmatimonadales bacterium]